MKKNKITAILMLSGYSKRMGKDKLLMKIKGKCIVDYAFEVVYKSKFYETIAVVRKKEILKKAEKLHFKTVLNNNAKKGISESIKLGVVNASKLSLGYMFFQGDQILIKLEDIKIIVDTFLENKDYIIVPLFNGIISSPCIFPKKFKNKLLELQDEESGKKIIKENEENVMHVNLNSEYGMLDIDNISDLIAINNILN